MSHFLVQIEELSNQNEDLIEKLKESMERELILRYTSTSLMFWHILCLFYHTNCVHYRYIHSSKRAAQINHTVSNITAEQSHHQSYHHLPSIGAAAGKLCRLLPCDCIVSISTRCPKRYCCPIYSACNRMLNYFNFYPHSTTGANAGLRTHSQPEQSVAAGAKKATRKKRA